MSFLTTLCAPFTGKPTSQLHNNDFFYFLKKTNQIKTIQQSKVNELFIHYQRLSINEQKLNSRKSLHQSMNLPKFQKVKFRVMTFN